MPLSELGTMGKRVYIGGPMRGKKHFNFPAFDRAATDLWKEGHIPINPADLDRVYEGWDSWPPEDLEGDRDLQERCMRRDLNAIFECDAIYLLRGWEESAGARVEKALAEFLGLIVIEQE